MLFRSINSGWGIGYDEDVDLGSPDHQAFLKAAAQQGAKITFALPNDDEPTPNGEDGTPKQKGDNTTSKSDGGDDDNCQ